MSALALIGRWCRPALAGEAKSGASCWLKGPRSKATATKMPRPRTEDCDSAHTRWALQRDGRHHAMWPYVTGITAQTNRSAYPLTNRWRGDGSLCNKGGMTMNGEILELADDELDAVTGGCSGRVYPVCNNGPSGTD